MKQSYAWPLRGLPARAAVFFTQGLTGAGWLLLAAWLLLATFAARAQAPATGAAPSVGTALNPDGTLRRGQAGSFDAKGYRMTLDTKTGAPVFRTTGTGDENWSDNFGLNGASGQVSAQVSAVATAANGDVYVGGAFTTVGAVVANNVARWNGTAWSGLGNGTATATTTNNGVNGGVNALAVRGTDLYVGGGFTSAYAVSGTQALSRVARWDGTAWSGLGNGATAATATNNGVNNTVNALAVLGTDLYVGGGFASAYSTSGTQALRYVARWDGTAWSGLGNGAATATTSNNGVNSTVQVLAVLGADLYVGGAFNSTYAVSGTQALNYVARWSGTAWSGLGNGATTATATNNGVNSTVAALAVLGTDLYVGGAFTSAYTVGGAQALNRVARWDGTAWSGLGNGATAATATNNGVNAAVQALAALGTDLYVGGNFTSAYSTSGTQALRYVARWDGTAWSGLGNGAATATTSNNGVNGTVNALAVLGTDLYVGGQFTSAYSASSAQALSRVARWDGTTWSGLGTGQNGASGQVNAVATAANGDVYVGGAFTTVGTVVANNVARWDGTAWSGLGNGTATATTTNNGVNGGVNALAVRGTDLYVGGGFTSAYRASGTQLLNRVARWDGTAWNGLGNGATAATATNNGVNGTVLALAALGTDLYVGGNFTNAYGASGAQALRLVARWDGTAWSGLGNGAATATTSNNGVSGTVNALAVLGTDLYVGGNFTSAYSVGGTQLLNYVARWDGMAWNGLGNGAAAATATNNGVNSGVQALVGLGTDLYVGGNFTSAYSAGGTQALNYVARWDGTAWNGLGNGAAPATSANNGVSNTVLALAALGTDLYVGGNFLAGGMQALRYVARWSGTAWSGLGTGLNSTVRALAAAGSRLAVGGSFTTVSDGSKVLSSFGFYTPPPPAPTLTAVAPNPGGLGQTITLTGTNLGSPTALTINGASALASVSSNTGTSLVVRVPVGAAAAGTVSITTAGGTATLPFSIMAAPGNALAFDGGSDYVRPAGTLPATGEFTLEAWVNPAAFPYSLNALVLADDFPTGAMHCQFYGSQLGFTIAGNNPTDQVSTVGVPLNRWTHVAVVYSASAKTANFYYNGVLVDTRTYATALAVGAQAYSVGTWLNGGNPQRTFTGRLDELRLYGAALTQAQVQADMLSTASAVPASLSFYLNFDQGTPASNNAAYTTLYDLASAQPATLTNFDLSSGNTSSNYVASYALVVPTATAATSRTATSFIATWAAPANGTVTGYVLDVSTAADFSAPVAGSPFTAPATATSYGVTGLMQNMTYYYRVRALNSSLAQADQGAESNVVSVATPLPVVLTAFTATAEGPAAVRLAWATASERNSQAFEVERSLDGVSFGAIGTVAAAGTTATAHTYALRDAALPTGTALLYYRLKQVDLDGSFTYSPVRVVALAGAAGLSLYPNPTAGAATLTGAEAGAVVQVLDALGRVVGTAVADAVGTATLPAGLPAGVYVVRSGGHAQRLTVN